MNQRYVIGLDGGGTNTRAVLIDESGRVHARSTGGPSNIQVVGLQGLRDGVRALVHPLWKSAGSSSRRVDVLCLGLAGAGRPEDQAVVRQAVGHLDIAQQILVVTDGEAALEGAHGGGPGLIVVSGTGSLAWGKNPQGEIARAGGWGYRIGDLGSGYEIGRQAIAAALKAADGMAEETLLTDRICARLDLPDITQTIRWIHRKDILQKEVADLTPLVFEAARAGDRVAQRIVESAARDLGRLVRTVARRLHMDGPLPLSLIGGVFEEKAPLLPRLRAVVEEGGSRLDILTPRFPPVVGSALIALRSLGVGVTDDLLQRLAEEQ